uniref:Uncharacterized protein n=1 Tax=Trichobilharzia regenti TaxID=157069 RepID=A0AA85KCZ3_TRIRE|nr:unnamed protein product [Trichobilharzia regenti]
MTDTSVIGSTCFTFPLQSFLEAKAAFNHRRSTHKIHFSSSSQDSVWNTLAPDFSLHRWKPCPPVRNSRESMKPKLKISYAKESYDSQKWDVELNYALEKDIYPKLKFSRSIRPFTAKILFVKCGSFKPGPYKMPKPHDFRGLTPTNERTLPEFITIYERDPMNINFLKKTRQQIWGTNCDEIILRKLPHSFLKPLKQGEKWEKNLYLPREPYPNREKCFTRHRLQFRDPHEVFLDKVGEKLEVMWKAQQKRETHLSRRNTCA